MVIQRMEAKAVLFVFKKKICNPDQPECLETNLMPNTSLLGKTEFKLEVRFDISNKIRMSEPWR